MVFPPLKPTPLALVVEKSAIVQGSESKSLEIGSKRFSRRAGDCEQPKETKSAVRQSPVDAGKLEKSCPRNGIENLLFRA